MAIGGPRKDTTSSHSGLWDWKPAPQPSGPPWPEGIAVLCMLECSGIIITHRSLELLGSSSLPTSVSRNQLQQIREYNRRHVGPAGLELLTSGNPPALASQCAAII
ncbi:hypothetical protein AAY473_015308, partial [Plecturocebus cupreus]